VGSAAGWPPAAGGCPHHARPRGTARRSSAAELRAVTHALPVYPNFVEVPADASAFFDADTWARLRLVKALYDPTDLFQGNHHIPPAN
jgi:hypothetical protein